MGERSKRIGMTALALGLLLGAGGAAAQIYKWKDAKGVVHFSDQPPRDTDRVERKSFGGGGGAELPYALAQAVRKSPVVLYTSAACAPCDQGRSLLQQRGIPFSEKTVSSSADQQALVAAGGADLLPVLLVGGGVRRGFQAKAWNEALSDAAYPAKRMLPANYKNPAAEPAAPPPPRDAVPEPEPAPAPAPAPRPPASELPPGFRF